MKSLLLTCSVAACAFWGSMVPVQSQGVITEFREEHVPKYYDSVKGWTVYKLGHGYADMLGCGAASVQRDGQLLIEKNGKDWQLMVPTSQKGRFGGAVMVVDFRRYDAQFEFHNGFATKILTND